MKQREMNRYWCGKVQFPGLESFVFGSVMLDRNAQQHEVDEALTALWKEILPYPVPSFVAVPGVCFFRPEEEE